MNSVKSLFIVAVLVAVGVGLYVKINSMPEPQPPKDFSGTWGVPPSIDMGGVEAPLGVPSMGGTSASASNAGGTAPMFNPGVGGGTAPVYVPPSGGTAPPSIGSSAGGGGTAGVHIGVPHSTQDPFTTRISGGPSSPDGGNAAPPFGGASSGGSLPPRDTSSNIDSYNPGGSPPGGAAPPTAQSPTLFYQPEHATFDEAWAEARSLMSRLDLAGAHLLLSAWYGNPTLLPAEQEALVDLLSGLAGTVIYSTENYLEPAYQVQPGETLEQIAQRYNVPTELLAKINGVRDPQHLTSGQQLKVVRGPFGAMVNASRNEMVLVLAGRYAGRFNVGIGRERTDIEGAYEVKRKVTNPPYFGPDRTIEPGDPSNPLGTHFLSLIKPLENEVAAPFGIHGTNDPQSLQRDEPRGYVRLAPNDIADAYDILSEKSQVLIRR